MTISKIYHSKVSIPALFKAWISPEMVIHPVTKIEVEPKVGGHLILHSGAAPNTSIMKGKFLELEQNKKLKYTWQWDKSDEKTMITVIFTKNGETSTINLKHEGFLTKESEEMHSQGWDYYIKELENKLKHRL